jgi:hypothetical protein
LAKKSVKGVEEVKVCFDVACLHAWMVDRGKDEGKLLVALFPHTCFPTQSLLANLILMLMNLPANLPFASVVIGGCAPTAFQPSWYRGDRMIATPWKL